MNKMNKEGKLNKLLEDTRRNAIIEAIREAGGNNAKAARALGISRSLIVFWLEEWRLKGYDVPAKRRRNNDKRDSDLLRKEQTSHE